MSDTINSEKFDYRSKNYASFFSNRCDFKGGIVATIPLGATREEIMQDVSEMIGFHAVNIRPKLNGFTGYGCIKYTITPKKP